ncbi:MAG TPA: hypothetical protein VFO44_04870, partial [Steroidobacteraceae bacterium]|nr:hypothetical protein [Steroidobacteraceae bacterium]
DHSCWRRALPARGPARMRASSSTFRPASGAVAIQQATMRYMIAAGEGIAAVDFKAAVGPGLLF